MAKFVDNKVSVCTGVTDRWELNKLAHYCAALMVKCWLEGDTPSMNMFEKLARDARTRSSELYGGFDEGHLHFYRSLSNFAGYLRNHTGDLSTFKFPDDRFVVEALSHGVSIPEHMLSKPVSHYQVQPVAEPASERRVLDILEKFAKVPLDRIEVAAATRVYKPALSRANRQVRLEEKRGDKRRVVVSRGRGDY